MNLPAQAELTSAIVGCLCAAVFFAPPVGDMLAVVGSLPDREAQGDMIIGQQNRYRPQRLTLALGL